MPVKITFAAPFHRLTAGVELIDHQEGVFADILSSLDMSYPGLWGMLMKEGKLRDDFMVLVNDRDISLSQGGDTFLKDGDEVLILPVIAGG